MLPTVWSAPIAAPITVWEIDVAVLTATAFNAPVGFDDPSTFFDGIDPLLISN